MKLRLLTGIPSGLPMNQETEEIFLYSRKSTIPRSETFLMHDRDEVPLWPQTASQLYFLKHAFFSEVC